MNINVSNASLMTTLQGQNTYEHVLMNINVSNVSLVMTCKVEICVLMNITV